jgi:putative phosphoribosyl transferase
MEKYADRQEAGKILAGLLTEYADHSNTIVLALPRGGVPVAFEISSRLHLPLDVFIVRKLGAPGQEELAVGAIASGGVQVLNDNLLREMHVSSAKLEKIISREQEELLRREIVYRGDRGPLHVFQKNIILVDDGIATGATMRAAIKALRLMQPLSIVIAVPVAEKFIYDKMAMVADKVICPALPEVFRAVGWHYSHFDQTGDEEVIALLNRQVL